MNLTYKQAPSRMIKRITVRSDMISIGEEQLETTLLIFIAKTHNW
jgi:hypothetical protein